MAGGIQYVMIAASFGGPWCLDKARVDITESKLCFGSTHIYGICIYF